MANVDSKHAINFSDEGYNLAARLRGKLRVVDDEAHACYQDKPRTRSAVTNNDPKINYTLSLRKSKAHRNEKLSAIYQFRHSALTHWSTAFCRALAQRDELRCPNWQVIFFRKGLVAIVRRRGLWPPTGGKVGHCQFASIIVIALRIEMQSDRGPGAGVKRQPTP
ncbi:hypothetical protein ACJJTC_008623 [Scirpophaga incertulas]